MAGGGDGAQTSGWMDVVRPALRMKMKKYGGDNIRFSLLALVDDQYQAASDEFELLKREKRALERRLNEVYPDGWESLVREEGGSIIISADSTFFCFVSQVDPHILALANEAFTEAAVHGPTFGPDFGPRGLKKDMSVLDMPERQLINAWQDCVKAALPAKIAVQDEVSKSVRAHVCVSLILNFFLVA